MGRDADTLFMEELAGGDEELLSKLNSMRTEMWDEHDLLISQLDTGALSPREFANQTNQLMERHFTKVAALIGKEKTEKFFEIKIGEPILLVDPDMMEKEYGPT